MKIKKSLILISFLLVTCVIGSNITPVIADGESWLMGWEFRRPVYITGSSGAGANYQINLTVAYEDEMQADFDDLRYTAADGFTELDYWIETYTASTDADVWVEVIEDLGTDQVIYQYWGNATVSTTSNGDNTFLLFDDFNDASINASKWTFSGATETGGTIVLDPNEYIKSVSTFNPSIAIEARTKSTNNRRYNMGFGAAVPFSGLQWITHNFDGNSYMYEGNDDTGTKTHAASGVYNILSLYWTDGSNGEYDVDRTGRQDRYDSDIINSGAYAGVQTWGSATGITYADWIFIRNWIETEPALGYFGDFERYGYDWIKVDDFVFYLYVPITESTLWAYNLLLIVAGLVMMPAATLYLAKGGRKEANMDKLFYALLIFFIGFALVVGGVMP